MLSRAILSRLRLPPTNHLFRVFSAQSPLVQTLYKAAGCGDGRAPPCNSHAQVPHARKKEVPHHIHLNTHTHALNVSTLHPRARLRRVHTTRNRSGSLLGSHSKEACAMRERRVAQHSTAQHVHAAYARHTIRARTRTTYTCRARSRAVSVSSSSWSLAFSVWCRSRSGFFWCLPRLWLHCLSAAVALLFWHRTWTFCSRRTSFRGRVSGRQRRAGVLRRGSSWLLVGSTFRSARQQVHIYASVYKHSWEYFTHFLRSSGLRP